MRTLFDEESNLLKEEVSALRLKLESGERAFKELSERNSILLQDFDTLKATSSVSFEFFSFHSILTYYNC